MFSIKGYVLEPVRVGANNSPFTLTPADLVSNSGDYGAWYDANETHPRTEYMVLVLSDGKLPSAIFGWTKNEGIQRFDYNMTDQQFFPLPGGVVATPGTLAADSNSNRIKLSPLPYRQTIDATAPYRISLGSVGSGITMTVSVVTADVDFTSPSSLPAGTVELSFATGNLNWSSADLVTYLGESVKFQQQAPFSLSQSNGDIGEIVQTGLSFTTVPSTILLNPIPGPGLFPLVRLGYSLYLTPVAVSTEGSFSSVASGTFQWAEDTGAVRFANSDLAANVGSSIFYDGILFSNNLTCPSQTIGTVSIPTSIVGLPLPGGDLIFRSTVHVPPVQFAQYELLASGQNFDPVGKSGVVQVKPNGDVQFSSSDQAKYGSMAMEVVFGDVLIERGISMRFFRTPVDLEGTNPDLKDVSALYSVVDASLASPIIQFPQVILPVTPLQTGLTFQVTQGTGTFTSSSFPALDGSSPPTGLGYFIDFSKNQFFFAQRKNNELISILQPSGHVSLDPLVFTPNLYVSLEIGTGTNTYNTLTQGVDFLVEPNSGMVTFIDTEGSTLLVGSNGSFSSSTFSDTSVDFSAAGILAGDYLLIHTTSAKGLYVVNTSPSTNSMTVFPPAPSSVTGAIYEVRRGKEILVDRFFNQVDLSDPNTKVEKIRSLGTASNVSRLQVQLSQLTSLRFRFGAGSLNVFTTSVNAVADDSSFTSPSSLPSNVVEVSLTTGHLNFSSVNVGQNVFSVLLLKETLDYRLDPARGLIQFTERLLSLDEALITYSPLDTTDPLNPVPLPPVQERATFLVRKEVVQPHPAVTDTLSFNVAGREIALNPPPFVWRRGRPQVAGTNYTINTTASIVTFLADGQFNNLTPHGSQVQPSENVYIDYYIYSALGGENTTAVLQPPMSFFKATLKEDTNTVVFPNDRTSDFPVSSMIRVEKEGVYLIGSSSYDGLLNQTTVTLYGEQVWAADYNGPNLYVSSGSIPLSGTISNPSYFLLETRTWTSVPRGMNKFRVQGDATSTYPSGVIVYFLAVSTTDFYIVSGSQYDPTTNQTEITLSGSTISQYGFDTHQLRYSIRPIYDSSTKTVQTKLSPILSQGYTVFRQVEGQPGQALVSPVDYSIDDSGKITFASPLEPSEAFSIMYTGHKILQPGPRVNASWTFQVSPNTSNGLLNQNLFASYTTFKPDSFFFRVETLTNFKGELDSQFKNDAMSTIPTSGPRTSNTASQQLYQKGRESIFFTENHLANEDVVARYTLKFYNDQIDYLEDLLEDFDGRVVGDTSGRFLFDGTAGTVRNSFSDALNQIDDTVKISPFPYTFTFPPLSITYLGTFVSAYKPGPSSRFYPTSFNRYSVTTAGIDTSANTGDDVLDIGVKSLTAVSNVHRRFPRTLITKDVQPGDTVIQVAVGLGDPTTPSFIAKPSMLVIITGRDGTPYVSDGAPLTVSTATSTTVTVSACPVHVPAGATLSLSNVDVANDTDTSGYAKNYIVGKDLTFNSDKGTLVYVKPYPPLNGTVPAIPKELNIQPVHSQEFLQVAATANNTATAPFRFPALDGGTINDDGDNSIPLQTPTPDNETSLLGSLATALSPSGTFSLVDAPLVSTGSLDVTKTIITNIPGSWSSPIPKLYDLVRITSGLNGATQYRQIIAVGSNTITVADAFSTQDTGFSFQVTVSNTLHTGTATAGTTTSALEDTTQVFQTLGVVPGHTVIITSLSGVRRQVVSISADGHTITLDHAVAGLGLGATYRIDKPLNTFSGVSDANAQTSSLLTVLQSGSTSEINSVLNFFEGVFTDFLSPSSQTGSVSGSVLTGTGDFGALGVTAVDYIYIESGANAGIYPIVTITSTTLTTSVSFPSPGSVTYRVVSSFDTSAATLASLFTIFTQAQSFAGSVSGFASSFSSVAVLVSGVADPNVYANGLLSSSISGIYTTVTTRQAALADQISTVQSIMAGGDKFYDKRYTWIDARINLESGILSQQTSAVSQRVKAQQQTINSLIKLLAVEG